VAAADHRGLRRRRHVLRRRRGRRALVAELHEGVSPRWGRPLTSPTVPRPRRSSQLATRAAPTSPTPCSPCTAATGAPRSSWRPRPGGPRRGSPSAGAPLRTREGAPTSSTGGATYVAELDDGPPRRRPPTSASDRARVRPGTGRAGLRIRHGRPGSPPWTGRPAPDDPRGAAPLRPPSRAYSPSPRTCAQASRSFRMATQPGLSGAPRAARRGWPPGRGRRHHPDAHPDRASRKLLRRPRSSCRTGEFHRGPPESFRYDLERLGRPLRVTRGAGPVGCPGARRFAIRGWAASCWHAHRPRLLSAGPETSTTARAGHPDRRRLPCLRNATTARRRAIFPRIGRETGSSGRTGAPIVCRTRLCRTRPVPYPTVPYPTEAG